jgi:hypothetical protein
MPKWFSQLARSRRLALAIAGVLAVGALGYSATQRLSRSRQSATAPATSPGSTSATSAGQALTPTPSPKESAPVAPKSSTTAPSHTAPPAPPAGARGYDHIFFVIDENHSRVDTLVSGSYLAGLAGANAQSTTDFAIGHPSEPNYVALFSGSTNGVTDDGTYNINAPNLADRIDASGRTWKGYMESMPSPCFTGTASPYARKHNPFISFTDISRNPSRCNRIVPFTRLATDLAAAGTTPSFVWITPNLDNDMHDGSVAQGDAWAAAHFPSIFNSPAWTTQHSLLIFTNDEDDGGARNNVPLFMSSSDRTTKTNFSSTVPATHYSVLRTIEAAWGLSPIAGGDAAASAMSDLFTGRLGLASTQLPGGSATTAATLALWRAGDGLEALTDPPRARLRTADQLS